MFGNIPEWVAAATGFIAVVAAITAGIYAKRTFALETERDEQGRLSRRRSQASRIAAWPAGFVHVDGRKIYGACIQNTSDALVYDVSLEFRMGRTPNAKHLRFLPSGTYFWDSEIWPFPTPTDRIAGLEPVMSTDKFEVDIHFRDAKNVRWARLSSGELRDLGDTARATASDGD